jgi:hypothetical protein
MNLMHDFQGKGHILSIGGDALSVQSPAVEQNQWRQAIVVSTFFVLLF